MSFKLSQMLTAKFVELIIIGQPVAPGTAVEIIRRTDTFFRGGWHPSWDSEYERNLRAAFGLPGRRHPADAPRPDLATQATATARWRRKWGCLDLRWMSTNQIAAGTGFCNPDGTLAFAGELEDYANGLELLHDFRMIALAFPHLTFDVAVWGDQRVSMLGLPMFDALETPWPPELTAQVAMPTLGFLVRQGRVAVVRGFDQRLFQPYSLGYPQAAELALRELRRLDAARTEATGFGQRQAPGLPDKILMGWLAHARQLGLAR